MEMYMMKQRQGGEMKQNDNMTGIPCQIAADTLGNIHGFLDHHESRHD